jgi:hypothetical protein
MREPAALNNLTSERKELANRIRKQLPDVLPQEIEALFNEWSDYFNEQVILRWREEKRFDELIDYLIYQYEIFDGHPPWEQILLDLRLEKDESRAIRLLEGLLKEREKRLRGTLSKLKENPDNLNLQVALTIHKASVLALLAEMEFIIANKPKESIDKAKVESLRKRIKKVQSCG